MATSMWEQKTEDFVLKVVCLDDMWSRDATLMVKIYCLAEGMQTWCRKVSLSMSVKGILDYMN